MDDRVELGSGAPDRRRFAAESDEHLFVLMAQRHTEPEAARAAFEELYLRHAPHLWGALRSLGPKDSNLRQDVLQQTFARVFVGAHKFKPDGLSLERARARVRAFLCKTARYVQIELLPRGRHGIVQLKQLHHEVWARIAHAPEPGAGDNGTLARVHKALSEIKPRDRELLGHYLRYYDPDLENQRIPPEILAKICSDYDVSPTNFRKIISRTLKKLGELLEDAR